MALSGEFVGVRALGVPQVEVINPRRKLIGASTGKSVGLTGF
jgi:hypothetical protein